MKVQKTTLALRKASNIYDSVEVNSHPFERWSVSNVRDDQYSRILKANETAVEQMVNARREKKPVLSIDPFFVGRIAPRLAVPGY